MNKKTLKRKRDLKTKLMAAISMLLVSSLMMVTSTYAWFTLSTAPEVTGITTAVGANGNLEMALLPASGLVSEITSNVGDTILPIGQRNATWGNLVDLSDTNTYGMNKITLYPAQLNAATKDANGNPLTLAAALLQTPTFGADGRLGELTSNTVTSTYDTTASNFPNNEEFGVRAVGVASGMTDRQLAYRNARSSANTAMNTAKTKASQSLNNNGSSLANVALKKATSDAPTFNDDDVASLQKIVTDLVGTVVWNNTEVTSISKNSTLGYIEQAYINYIYALAVSNTGITDDDANETKFKAVKAIVEAQDATLNSILATLAGDPYNIDIPDTVTTPVSALNASIKKVAEAQKLLNNLEDKTSITWNEISEPLYKLADTDAMLIAGYKASEVKDNMSAIINQVAGNGLTITIGTGGGVYADIADHCGNYDAGVTIAEVTYGGLTLNNMNAKMTTASEVSPSYLSKLSSLAESFGAPESAEGTTMPITDMYGYIVDLAFRTNAAESNLLLQDIGVDRIYEENGNEQTMGHGSTMTFKATTTNFSDDQVKSLMDAIRIVFFQKDGNKVVATAKLDTKNAELGLEGWTAKMYLYTVTAGGEFVYEEAEYNADATNVEYFIKSKNVGDYIQATVTAENFVDQKADLYVESEGTYTKVGDDASFAESMTYYTKATEDEYTKITEAPTAGEKVYIKTTTVAGENKKTDNVITALTQNVATQVSVLVYLDGNYVTNADVAATANTSVTGTMNLQFRSSAELVPMEYAALHIPATEGSEGGAETE